MSDRKKKGPLVLIVDDVPKNLQVLGSILRNEDYKVAAATSGKQALEMLDKIRPDLVLLDVMMPGMDGFEVCKIIRSRPETAGIPIIFLTASTGTDDIVKGFSVGAVDYVTKPFNSAELLARVRTHLKLKRLSGLLPICANCKKVRDDKGYWRQVEEYIAEHSDIIFSHGLCPGCVTELYPQLAEEMLADLEASGG